MEQANINSTLEFQKNTQEFFTGLKNYITQLEQKITEVTSGVDMGDAMHAKSISNIISGLRYDVKADIDKLGREYELKVTSLRCMVTNEYTLID